MIIDNVSDFTHAFLHRKYKPFTDAELTRLETKGDVVELSYNTKVGGGAISGRFVDRANVDMNAMELAFDYPYQRSSTDGKIKHWCFVLPIDERTTRAFFLFYFDCFVVPFTKVRIPRRVMKPFLKISNELLIKPLLREDGIAVEAEQTGYDKHWDEPVFDLNPAVLAFQAVIVRKWEAYLAEQTRHREPERLGRAPRTERAGAGSVVSVRSRDRRATVAILGAGPGGAACAAHLGQLGVQDVVLVDRHDFPRDKTCGSGISPKGIQTLKDLGVWHEIEPQPTPSAGVRLVTPGGLESWQSAGTKAEAVVCERRVFDYVLVKRAIARGTEFIPNFNATSVLEKDGRVEGDPLGRAGRRNPRPVRRHRRRRPLPHRAPRAAPRQTIQAIMGWWSGVTFSPNHVEMIFDARLRPYYGWLFPERPTGQHRDHLRGHARRPKHNAREFFQAFLDTHYRAGSRTRTQSRAGRGTRWSGPTRPRS